MTNNAIVFHSVYMPRSRPITLLRPNSLILFVVLEVSAGAVRGEGAFIETFKELLLKALVRSQSLLLAVLHLVLIKSLNNEPTLRTWVSVGSGLILKITLVLITFTNVSCTIGRHGKKVTWRS